MGVNDSHLRGPGAVPDHQAAGGRRLVYFRGSQDELLRRLGERNRRGDANALRVTESAPGDFIARFEPPAGGQEEITGAVGRTGTGEQRQRAGLGGLASESCPSGVRSVPEARAPEDSRAGGAAHPGTAPDPGRCLPALYGHLLKKHRISPRAVIIRAPLQARSMSTAEAPRHNRPVPGARVPTGEAGQRPAPGQGITRTVPARSLCRPSVSRRGRRARAARRGTGPVPRRSR